MKFGSSLTLFVTSGDLCPSANETCWPVQQAIERKLTGLLQNITYKLRRAHAHTPNAKHGFISSPKEGMEVFARLDSTAPIKVAEAVWQYSHHLLAGLESHRGPILTFINWRRKWRGPVGMLNLNCSLTKAALAFALRLEGSLCGTRADGRPF